MELLILLEEGETHQIRMLMKTLQKSAVGSPDASTQKQDEKLCPPPPSPPPQKLHVHIEWPRDIKVLAGQNYSCIG
jgi:hypothetical protein